MKSKRKVLLIFILGVILAGICSYGGVRLYKLSHYAAWFATVATGDTKETAVLKMGKPDVVHSRPHWLWCSAGNCDSEFMYGHSIPSEWWVIGFNPEGHVVWKAELQSP